MSEIESNSYRKDIDGIRAIAVLSVIFFHLGFLPNGYLGVDIFFAISGYLITKKIFNNLQDNNFSLLDFYLRRGRRILPLVIFTSLIALLIGSIVMLPDDFENLCQSVFATNLFSNNILLLITSGNYWAIVNEYKPLMHTWSLGIEEQFYLIYPFIFLLFFKHKKSQISLVLLLLSIISLLLFFFGNDNVLKFYSIQYRFFELSFGGLGFILFDKIRFNKIISQVLIIVVLLILYIDLPLPQEVKLFLIVIFSVFLVVSNNKFSGYTFLTGNIMVYIGKISFSLYMWHQIVLAFSRYLITDKPNVVEIIIYLLLIFGLSILSYLFIEKPFRNKNKIGTKSFLVTILSFSVVACSLAFYLYSIGGIIRDVPELEIKKSDTKFNHGSGKRNIHIEYNAKIYDLDKNFDSSNKTKVLVIGNSFARDFANILLESHLNRDIAISYIYDINNCENAKQRISEADFIFFSELQMNIYLSYKIKFNIDTRKVWNVGTKNFGSNNGIYYNRKRDENYCKQRIKINHGYLESNQVYKKQWGNKFIDLIGLVIDKEQTIPIFTDDCKFISQDCEHLTKAGSVYFAKLLQLNFTKDSIVHQ